ncbi:MAG: GIY-YIG nuclease family protein [Balneolaceae bacterium]|nr:GIY-YIG nuclease family protein [Balneolaceae bacterium]MCH8550116.1 GIY-YIG nuclease family protein [Balneolaceae bacterium]
MATESDHVKTEQAERKVAPPKSLFPEAQPLLEQRIGAERFSKVPTEPGIYRFYDAEGDIIYVGKAKNLRTRLMTYKRAKAGNVSRKTSRLVSRIRSFDLEITPDERSALLLENWLIRTHRPIFNHANKQTEAYYFIGIGIEETMLHFRLRMKPDDGAESDQTVWYGCFKGHNPVRTASGALLRLIWMALNNYNTSCMLPLQLTRRLTPVSFSVDLGDQKETVEPLLREFMLGNSCELIDWMVVSIDANSFSTNFSRRYFEHQLSLLKSFYDRKIVRHKDIRTLADRGNDLIAQNELDDFLVKLNV